MQQKLGQLAASTGHTNGRGHRSSVAMATVGNNASSVVVSAAAAASITVERIEKDIQRMRRTSHLLIWVGLMFCICWLPLNILNTVSQRG
jgi:hypothetical protein